MGRRLASPRDASISVNAKRTPSSMFDTRFRFKGLEECIGGLERVMRSPDWVGRIRFQRGRGLVPRDVRN
jgi:hypothetical protein